MKTYNVVEIFESINGEGMKAGELAVFVRMKGCNLQCTYCDTQWANEEKAPCKQMTKEEIREQIHGFGAGNVTVTGGEPLLQPHMEELLSYLAKDGYHVEIETNGSVDLKKYRELSQRIVFTMDYKLKGSGMEAHMNTENFSLLEKNDTVKFVVSDRKDLERAYEVEKAYHLGERCHVLISAVFGRIPLEDIVTFMREKKWTNARMQIQMHKVIWDPQKRGV